VWHCGGRVIFGLETECLSWLTLYPDTLCMTTDLLCSLVIIFSDVSMILSSHGAISILPIKEIYALGKMKGQS
jgi:hypothetical protein